MVARISLFLKGREGGGEGGRGCSFKEPFPCPKSWRAESGELQRTQDQLLLGLKPALQGAWLLPLYTSWLRGSAQSLLINCGISCWRCQPLPSQGSFPTSVAMSHLVGDMSLHPKSHPELWLPPHHCLAFSALEWLCAQDICHLSCREVTLGQTSPVAFCASFELSIRLHGWLWRLRIKLLADAITSHRLCPCGRSDPNISLERAYLPNQQDIYCGKRLPFVSRHNRSVWKICCQQL